MSDGLGDRLLMFDNTTTSSLELLRFRQDFARRPGFETALRDRVRHLHHFDHPSVAKVRAVEWLGAGEGLALISNHTPGRRLSDVLPKLNRGHGPGFVVGLMKQLTPALAALHDHGSGVTHGLLTPERIILTPDGRLVLIEHVIGSAVESLALPADQLQSELGLAARAASDQLLGDPRHDVAQLGVVALSMLLGRRLGPTDCTANITNLLDEYGETVAHAAGGPVDLRPWLERALQLDERSFESASDAHIALNHLLAGEASRSVVALGAPAQLPGSLPRSMSTNRTNLAVRHDEEFDPEPVTSPWSEPFEAEPTPAVAPPIAPVQTEPARTPPPVRRGRLMPWILAGLAVVAVAQMAVIARLTWFRPAAPPAAPPVANTAVNSPLPTPIPAANAVDSGTSAALPTTPASAAAALPPPAPVVTAIEITSDPPGARVTIDGDRKGVTPLTVRVEPGQHTVVVTDGRTTTTRTMNVAAGSTTAFVAALGAASAGAGWVTINTPIELQVREDGALLGTTSASRIMLPVGRHQLDLASGALGFQTTVNVDVQAGKTANVAVPLPNGSLSINALPWANVFVDGKAVGTTPLANLEVPIGTHEVIWRHPQFPEKRQTVVVTLKSPVRLVMDVSK